MTTTWKQEDGKIDVQRDVDTKNTDGVLSVLNELDFHMQVCGKHQRRKTPVQICDVRLLLFVSSSTYNNAVECLESLDLDFECVQTPTPIKCVGFTVSHVILFGSGSTNAA